VACLGRGLRTGEHFGSVKVDLGQKLLRRSRQVSCVGELPTGLPLRGGGELYQFEVCLANGCICRRNEREERIAFKGVLGEDRLGFWGGNSGGGGSCCR